MKLGGRTTAAIGIALSIVAAWCLALMFLMPADIAEDPGGGDRRIREIERQAFAKTKDPSIVILGTSRAAFGLVPRVIEDQLNLPKMSVVNGAYPSIYNDVLARLVSRNLDYLKRAELVVIGIDDYFGITEPSPHPSLAELPRAILQSSKPLTVIDTFLSEVVKQIDLRMRLYWTARNLREAVRLVRPQYLWDMADSGRWIYPPVDKRVFVNDKDYVSTSHAVADQYFRGQYSEDLVQIFENVLVMLRDHGVRLVILDLPPSLPYFEHRSIRHAEMFKHRNAVFEGMFDRLQIPVINCETSAACGLDEYIFADPVHMNLEGARRVSAMFAGEINRLRLVEARQQK